MSNTFAEIISNNFEEIKYNFIAGLSRKGYPYDEDILNDSFISCNSALKDKKLTKKEAIKYFWVSYINKCKTKFQKQQSNIVCSLDDEIEREDIIYNQDIDKIYDIIIKELQNKFGIRDTYIWDLYVCKGKSSKEIRSMGFNHIENFIYFSKAIKRYIKNHIIPNNQELQELINNRYSE